jgi:hypothetical protein
VSNRAFRAACFAWMLLVATGCATPPPPDAPAVNVISLSENIKWGNNAWAQELRDTYPNAIIVSVHGYSRGNEWWLKPDDQYVPLHADSVATILKVLYPNRPVIFVSCNEDARTLHVRGCYYAKKIVASHPALSMPGWANTVGAFVEGGAETPATRPTTQAALR